MALSIVDLLPDKWDGMSGSYQGKDLTILPYLYEWYKIGNKLQMTYLVTSVINQVSRITNDKIAAKYKKKK